MVAFLSQEWLDLHQSAMAALSERPGSSGTLQIVVTGALDGEVTYAQVIDDGRVTSATLGPVDGADVILTQTYKDAVAIARGEVELAAGFMQGRVKMVGETGALMRMLPLIQSDHYRTALATVASTTEF